MKKSYLLLSASVVLALVFRLSPYLVSSEPFSVDSWAPIRNAEVLAEFTPIDFSSELFDGYNSYWPFNSIYGLVVSLVIGIRVKDVLAAYVPLANAFSVLFVYLLAKKITRKKIAAAASAVFFSVFISHVVMGAGVTKEAYASTLYLSLLFSALFLIESAEAYLLVSLLAFSLVFSHHFTSLFAWLIIVSILGGVLVKKSKCFCVKRLCFLVVLVSVLGVVHYVLWGSKGMRIVLREEDILSLFSYEFTGFMFTLLMFSLRESSRERKLFSALLCMLAVFGLMIIMSRRHLVSGMPLLSSKHFALACVFPIITFFGVYGAMSFRDKVRGLIVCLWLVSVVSFMCFAVFSGYEGGFTLSYRSLSFVAPPLLILAGFGLSEVFKKSLLTCVFVFIVLVWFAGLCYFMIFSLENYTVYFWFFYKQDMKAGVWLNNFRESAILLGDVRVSYFMQYFNIEVKVDEGLKFIQGDFRGNAVFYEYGFLEKNGYLLGPPYGFKLPEGWKKELSVRADIVYDNSWVVLWYVGSRS